MIDSKCEKRRKGIYGPSAGSEFSIFVDDVNMPSKEEFGAQPPIELLRQWFDSGGWYDRKSLEMRKIIGELFFSHHLRYNSVLLYLVFLPFLFTILFYL